MSVWQMLIIFPLIGAVIGWCTNWLAVKMIFRPREPMRLPGLTLHGLLPRRRKELAQNVAETVERDLLSVDMIQNLVRKLVEGDEIRTLLQERIDTLVSEQMDQLGPMVRNFVPKDLVEKLKSRIETEILSFIGGMAETLHRGIESNLDIREMVRTRIEGFDLDRLEEIVFRIAAKELRHIEILGGILGFVVGLAEVGILQLMK